MEFFRTILYTVLALAWLQLVDGPSLDYCSYDKHAADIDMSYCGLTDISETDVIELKNASSINFSDNNILNVASNSFEKLTNLKKLNFSKNYYLLIPDNECFIISDSIEILDVSFTYSGEINPNALICLTKLKYLVKIGGLGCQDTSKLENENMAYNVICERNKMFFSINQSNSEPPLIPDNSENNSSIELGTNETTYNKTGPVVDPTTISTPNVGLIIGVIISIIVIGIACYCIWRRFRYDRHPNANRPQAVDDDPMLR